MIDDVKLKKIENKLKKFDWSYEMSDDFRYWRAGESAKKEIRNEIENLLNPFKSNDTEYINSIKQVLGVLNKNVQQQFFKPHEFLPSSVIEYLKKVSPHSILKEELTKSDEREIRRIIKDTVDDEIKSKIEKAVRDELKGKANERLIIQIIKNAMSSAYKTLWMRRATWLSGVENKEN